MEAKEGEESGLGGVEGGAILYEMVNETWDAVERWVFAVLYCISIAIFMWDDMTVAYRPRAHPPIPTLPPEQPDNQNPTARASSWRWRTAWTPPSASSWRTSIPPSTPPPQPPLLLACWRRGWGRGWGRGRRRRKGRKRGRIRGRRCVRAACVCGICMNLGSAL